MRIVSAFLVFLMTISCICPGASAYDLNKTKEPALDACYNDEIPTDQIVNALSSIERSKDAWGLMDIDFEKIYIGDPVYTYVYSDNSFVQSSKLYPLSYDSQLILLAVECNGMITITTELVDTLNNAVNFEDSFAIIYDSNGGYICTDDTCIQITGYDTNDEIEKSSTLSEYNGEFSDEIIYTKLIDKYPLPYATSHIPYAADYNYSCNVSEVNQLPDEHICWAACIACIVNYRKGTHFSAQDIAKQYYGLDYNYTLKNKDVISVFDTYGITYIADLFYVTDYQIFNNLRLGYPLYSAWTNDGPVNKRAKSTGHACVIFGIDTYSGYISIMDPWGGHFYLAEYNGHTYWFNCSSGYQFSLNYAFLHRD